LNAFIKDPYLTKKGVEQSIKAGRYILKHIPQVDIVLSSSLIRAIETAVCMFPFNKIEVSPFICESRPSLENTPYSNSKQTERLKAIKDYQRVKLYAGKEGASDTDLKKFIEYLTENYDVENKCIAIVTHSNFLMDIFNIKERMNNNSVYKVTVDTSTYRVNTYTCLFSGYTFPTTVSLQMAIR
jgi:phosphohistidine phosphatase SixA